VTNGPGGRDHGGRRDPVATGSTDLSVQYSSSGSCNSAEVITIDGGIQQDAPFFFLVP
jgi:hypothetical protein